MPEEYMGDVIGDINSRRGRIEGMDDLGGGKIVRGYRSIVRNVWILYRSYVPEHRDVVTTQCSSRNTSQYRSQYRKRVLSSKND